MKTVLHLDSSPRRTNNEILSYNSISKKIAKAFIDALLDRNDEKYELIYRDLVLDPPPYITQDWIGAVFTPAEKRSPQQKELLWASDIYINEVKQADLILISSPMYNYGMPAILKAWFDQVIRINETFTFDLKRGDFPLEPTLTGKKLILVTSSGEFGFEKGGIREKMDHLVPHIKTLGNYLGASEFYEIKSQYQEFSDKRHEKSLERAMCHATELAQKI